MSTTIEEIARVLGGGKKSGAGIDCKCPAHADKKASLSLSTGDKGGVVFKCHAGCSQDAVLAALKARGLWNGARGEKPQIVATYDYRDRHGKLVSQAVRYSGKEFKQRRPDGAGGWIWKMEGVPRLPYKLPEVLDAIAAAETVYIVEGEKDADNVSKTGLVATCNAAGAGKWQASHSQWFKGANVIILPDNDDPGRAHAQQVAKSLAGIAESVKIVKLPGLPPKGDVSDWLAAGGTREALDEIVEQSAQVHDGDAGQANSQRFPRIWVDDAKVDLTNTDIIKHLIGARTFSVIYGPAGQGKTFFTIDLVLRVAEGKPWRGKRVRGSLVVYVAAEAGASIVKRFVAARDREKHRAGKTPLAIITRGANLLNLADVEALTIALQETAKERGMPVGLVVFDTYSRSTPGGKEDAEDTSAAIGVADRLRDELGTATLFVHHSGKDPNKGARGHSGLEAAADTVIYVEGTPQGIVSGCVAEVEKVRDGAMGEQFPFRLDVVELGVDEDGDPVTTCVVVPTDAGVTRPKSPQLSGAARVALQALEEVLSDKGSIMAGTSTIPKGVKAARIEEWRARFGLRYGKDGMAKRDDDAVRQGFHRAKEALLKVRAVGISDPYCWSTS